MELEGFSSLCQVVWLQGGARSTGQSVAVGVLAVEPWDDAWIYDSDAVTLREKGVLISNSCFDVVNALKVRQTGSGPDVGERSGLGNALALQVGRPIRKRIGARIVIVLVLPQVSAECKHRVWIEDPRPRWSDVKGLDLRPLI